MGKVLTVSGIILASIAFVVELILIPMILTEIQFDLQLGITHLSWIFNSYAIAVAFAVFVTGIIGDRIQKYRIFIFGVLLFVLGSLLSSISKNFEFLLISRVLQGLGGGLFSPLVPILLARAFPDSTGKILIIWSGLAGIVATVMPFIGGGLVWYFGWRTIFVLISVVAFTSLIISSRTLISVQTEKNNYIASYSDVLSVPSIWLLLLYIFFIYGCLSYFLFYFPIFMSDLNYSGRFLSLFLSIMWFSFSAASYSLRNDVDGKRLKLVLMIAPAFFAAGYVLGVSFSESSMVLLLSAILVGVGFACCNAPSTHLLFKLSPDELHVFSASLDIVFARLGGVAAVALFSAALPMVSAGYVVAMAALALVCCYLCFVFTETRE